MRFLVSWLALVIASNLVSAQLDCESGSCGEGTCRPHGPKARCTCPNGYTGYGCKRPCQDVYRSCQTRWKRNGRCEWNDIVLFFDDNCAVTCGVCQPDDQTTLDIPFPPLLEPLSWLIGQWETESTSADRYPVDHRSGYKEILRIKQELVTMFDRPTLNFTATATATDYPDDTVVDTGFITSKLVIEETGFKNADKAVIDEVGLETNSNTGMNTVEEGELKGQWFKLNTTWIYGIGHMDSKVFASSLRTFSLESGQLKEHTEIVLKSGATKSFTKYFTKTIDFLAL